MVTHPSAALGWLRRLRWHALMGQTAAVLVGVLFFDLKLPLAPVALTLAAGLLIMRVRNLLAVLILDVAELWVLLALCGGPDNPFTTLLLVHATLASMLLPPRKAVAVSAVAAALYASLYVWHVPLVIPVGPWIGVLLSSAIMFFFVVRMNSELERSRQRAAQAERLATLGHFVSEAAHEIGSPLSTIAVAANEIEATVEEAAADARLIRDEAERCMDIMKRMSLRAGQTLGESPTRFVARDVFALVTLTDEERARVSFVSDGEPVLFCPMQGLASSLHSLIKNALQASAGPVTVGAATVGGRVRFTVEDQGGGIPPHILERIGEPFFSTKPTGTGLGVFLSRSFAELCEGSLDIHSRAGVGTQMTLWLPHESAHR